ncbi:MAG: efflux transporter outer membrane subunit [Thiobacillaceae bacterium]
MKFVRLITAASLSFSLTACALFTPQAIVPGSSSPQLDAVQWFAPLPHNGSLTDLSQWWAQHGDPLLVNLIESAQAVSPSIASAKTRIEQARATRVIAGAALLPRLDASASGTRSSAQPPVIPTNTSLQAGLQASWELDMFGANRASRNSAQVRYEGAQALWHDARVSVAADIANLYYSLRTCEKVLAISRADAASRAETSRLTALTAEAGFTAPATAALARASAAEASSRVTWQRAQCDLDVKALVALTAIDEPTLRQKLIDAPASLSPDVGISIASVPAHILAQRPDVFNAEHEQVAASLDVGAAEALRYPRLTLSGSVGVSRFSSGGVTTDLSTWSVGPLALTVPLFDGGRSAANLEAVRVRYEEASTQYRSTVRNAVREVEEALVNLYSTGARNTDAATALAGYQASFNGTKRRYQEGLASLIELEDARRTWLAAEIALISLQQERMAAWVSLYRAAGGGWGPERVAPVASALSAAPL